MTKVTRRRFLEDSLFSAFAASVAAAGAVSAVGLAPQRSFAQAGANELLGVAIVGGGGRADDHINNFGPDKRVQIRFICDPDTAAAEHCCKKVEDKFGYRPKAIKDFREILEDKSVDAVACASPNHWHALTAIWALQAGKHCYIEKPLTYNIFEGKVIEAAVKKYKLVFQTGTQCRSHRNVQDVVQFVRDGGIGDVKFARGLCYKRRKAIGPLGKYPVPHTVDYDLWSGPAQIKDVTRPKFHYDWHWQRYYGNGDLGNQGPHQTDIARWFLDVERFPESVISYGGRLGYDVEKESDTYVDAGDVANTEVSIYDYGDKCMVFETRGLKTPNLNIPGSDTFGTQVGVIAYGTKGYAIQGNVKSQSYFHAFAYDLDCNELKAFTGGGNHYTNFVDAVLANDPSKVNADARCGALSAAVSHLGNTSYYLGEKNKVSVDELKSALESVKSLDDNAATLARTVQHLEENGVDLKKTPLALGPMLKIDVEKEVFIDNDEANAMMTRDYRAPYIVPKPEDV